MFNTSDPEVFWLTATNLVLALVVLTCILVVARAVYQEIRLRNIKRNSPSTSENRALVIPLVGPTMADGGEPIGAKSTRSGKPPRPTIEASRKPQTGK